MRGICEVLLLHNVNIDGTFGTEMQSTSHRQSRRRHAKTKTGCRVCKRRKIKCDEQRPSCRNCIKHATQCDFQHELETSSTQDAPLSNHLNILDLELLHNYTIATYSTLSNVAIIQQLWKVTVPKMGFSCNYIMLSILAISSLHTAFHRADKKSFYTCKALLYHQQATQEATSAMSTAATVTVELAEQLYIFSVMNIYISLASSRNGSGFFLSDRAGCPSWMSLAKGTKSMLRLMGDNIEHGPLGPMFRQGQSSWVAMHQEPSPASNTYTVAIHELQMLLDESIIDERAREVYSFAISELLASFRLLERSTRLEITDVFVWVWEVADEFIPLLEVPTQEAVVIFTYFCVLLKSLDSKWWLQNWAEYSMSQVYDCLDDTHKLWIRWPIEQLGWVHP